jgi:hypothetical protein
MASGDPLVDAPAPLELERRPPPPHWPHGRWRGRRRTGSTCSTSHRCRSPGIDTVAVRSPTLASAQPRLTADTVESPLPGDRHGRFGERPGETDREQSRHRAPGRLNHRSAGQRGEASMTRECRWPAGGCVGPRTWSSYFNRRIPTRRPASCNAASQVTTSSSIGSRENGPWTGSTPPEAPSRYISKALVGTSSVVGSATSVIA